MTIDRTDDDATVALHFDFVVAHDERNRPGEGVGDVRPRGPKMASRASTSTAWWRGGISSEDCPVADTRVSTMVWTSVISPSHEYYADVTGSGLSANMDSFTLTETTKRNAIDLCVQLSIF